MTDTKAPDQDVANPAANGGDHDRVAMLSLKADGSPDQLNPEIIGDKNAAIAATTEQFKQQAVSAADVEIRGASTDDSAGTSTTEDPTVAELKAAHDAAADGAEASAKKVVEALHQGVGSIETVDGQTHVGEIPTSAAVAEPKASTRKGATS